MSPHVFTACWCFALQGLGPKTGIKGLQRLSLDNAGRILSAMSPRNAVANLLTAENPWAFNTLKGMKESAALGIMENVDTDSAAQLMSVSLSISGLQG